MSFNMILILAIVGAIGVSSLAATHVHSAAMELSDEVRKRIERALAKVELFLHALEWGGVAIIVLSLYSDILVKAKADSYVVACCGAALMCLSSIARSCYRYTLYKREAPESAASGAARNAAVMVTLAELALIGVLIGLLSSRGYLSKAFKGSSKSRVEQPDVSDNSIEPEKGLWLDQAAALKELNWLKQDELEMIGGIKTQTVAGKKMYRAQDIERLKSQHKGNTELPE